MKRPLAFCAAALVWGIILADVNISHSWGMVSLAASLAALLLFYRPVRGKASRFLLLAIPFMLLGYALHSIDKTHHEKVFQAFDNQSVTVEGRVYDEPEFLEGKTRFTLEVGKINGRIDRNLKNTKIRVSIYSEEPVKDLQYGSFARISGEFGLPQGRRNPGGFDTRKYLAAKEISATLSVPLKALAVLPGKEASWLKNAGYGIRRTILQTLDRFLPPKEASLLAGMLIGYTRDMPEEMEEDFRTAGLSHVLAVSGANIAFLLLPLLWLLQHIGFNRRWSSAIAFPMMLFYVFATGMEASVVRAAVMAGVTLIGMIFWRKTDIFCSMATSAIILLLLNTYMLFDVGFILSFTATLSLVVFHKPLFEKLPKFLPKFVRDTLAGTLAAQIGVAPVIAYNFNTVSAVSVVSNLLVIPLTGFLTLLGALLAALGSVFAALGSMLGMVTRLAADGILFITENIAGIPWAEISIATPDLLLVIIYYLVLIYLRYGYPMLPKDAARPVLAGIMVFCGVLLVFAALPEKSLRICFTDVGQGDCILIRTPEGKNIIIDGGGSINDEKGSYAGERIVVPLLYDLNMTGIDLMIATHGHADHIGGLASVVDEVPVKRLLVADAPDKEMRGLIELASMKGVPIDKVKQGAILFEEGELTLKAVYPFKEDEKMAPSTVTGANELSLVTRLDYGEFSALFTGDIGNETESRILEDGRLLQCDVLKVAHHGSKYSSSESFLNAAHPSLAIVSVGRNRYGHPSLDVLQRIKEQGTKVYQTLESGGIMLEAWEKGDRVRLQVTVR